MDRSQINYLKIERILTLCTNYKIMIFSSAYTVYNYYTF